MTLPRLSILSLMLGLTSALSSVHADTLPECSTAKVHALNLEETRTMIASCNKRLAILRSDSETFVAKFNADPKKGKKDAALQANLQNVLKELNLNSERLVNLRFHRAKIVVEAENTRMGFKNVKHEAVEPPNPDVATELTKKLPVTGSPVGAKSEKRGASSRTGN